MADSISTSSTKDEDELATVMAKKPSKEKLRLSHSEIELRRCLSDTESSFEPLLKREFISLYLYRAVYCIILLSAVKSYV